MSDDSDIQPWLRLSGCVMEAAAASTPSRAASSAELQQCYKSVMAFKFRGLVCMLNNPCQCLISAETQSQPPALLKSSIGCLPSKYSFLSCSWVNYLCSSDTVPGDGRLRHCMLSVHAGSCTCPAVSPGGTAHLLLLSYGSLTAHLYRNVVVCSTAAACHLRMEEAEPEDRGN